MKSFAVIFVLFACLLANAVARSFTVADFRRVAPATRTGTPDPFENPEEFREAVACKFFRMDLLSSSNFALISFA